MPRWWQFRETSLAASNMVLGLRYAPTRFVEANLLSAVGTAEAEEHRCWVKSTIRNDPMWSS
ncbi:hypothetical protein [Saccharopolyspora pogona]|uniref:hypothetical protein n=1 Tax=Saccharopolyspora pogona TaxID=333966 RepID=UPI0016844516|nr:hypothetical protein [Saccharopolyspora pogona]